MGSSRKIKFTGERLIPSVHGFIKSEHLHRYALAGEFSENKIVLDVACGEGYGTKLISKSAKLIWGLDIDEESIINAKNKYQASNLNYEFGDIDNMPFDDKKFDLVICFETIEHVKNYHNTLNEIKRVIKDDGILIMSTPNKLVYSDNRNFKNKYHTYEFYIDEYKSWINNNFINNTFLFQSQILGSYLYVEPNQSIINFKGNYTDISKINNLDFKYVISISSNTKNTNTNSSIFFDSDSTDLFEMYCKKSLSYKIGNIILYPFKLIIKWIESLL
jgi:2-polyprenyl-3-methyl-5-hydroxy-6-metoxy-1,4-benzoquinol methylase